jgi:NADH-quinone oxidoreductase subunit F
MQEIILTKNISQRNSHTLEGYRESGGYKALKKALKDFTPAEIIEEVKASGLRGRGGAGFPTGAKWSFLPKKYTGPVYLICNADEGEPGTFKDRMLIERFPHQLIEGIIISSYAINCNNAYVFIRGEFSAWAQKLQKAVDEAYEAKLLGENILKSKFSLHIAIHQGGGSYVCGEETALLESLEGKRGNPRIKPPYPVAVGLFNKPTVINNVETLSNIPHIINNGSTWFHSFGTEKSPGTKLICLSGHIKKPGVYEVPMGISLRKVLYELGNGITADKQLKAVIPGGAATAVLKADEIDVAMDYESLQEAGSSLGSGGVIVMHNETCMVQSLLNLMRFFAHESCGQCTPCRQGTSWMVKILTRITKGQGRPEDLDLLLDICDNISLKTLCPLGDGAVCSAVSFITKFREEFKQHIDRRSCPVKKSITTEVST